jgi:HD superfamily phosphohydrolase
MEIRDAVHGFVELYDQEAAIVDHPAFQRLRRIHQLAMAYLVYPGATHTRFEHSLGVLHVADRLARRLGLTDDTCRNVRLAALVHDLGHGPFSHISEEPLAACSRDHVRGVALEKLHERITVDIVREVLLRERLITREQAAAVEDILGASPSAGRTVERDIVSGPLDADKLDYLLRDSHHAGVRYGIYDLDRVVQAVRVLEDSSGSYLAIADEDVAAVDQVVIARHHMATNVYRHRIRRITDAMLVRAVLLSVRDGNDGLGALYTYKPKTRAAFVKRFLSFDDQALVQSVLGGPSGPGTRLMQRLCDRRLLKEVLREPVASFRDASLLEPIVKRREEAEPAARDLEARIAEVCRVGDPSEVFAGFLPSKPPRPTLREPMIDPEAILVVGRSGSRTTYDRASQFFRHGELKGDDLVCVYVPVDIADRTRRRGRMEQLRKRIAKLLRLKEE